MRSRTAVLEHHQLPAPTGDRRSLQEPLAEKLTVSIDHDRDALGRSERQRSADHVGRCSAQIEVGLGG